MKKNDSVMEKFVKHCYSKLIFKLLHVWQ